MWALLFDIIAVVVLCVVGVLCTQRRKHAYPLPPGPKGLPVIGNALDIPKSREWITYEKWGKELKSDVIHAEALGTHLIILNSAKAVKELFERRSSLYSDRPTMVVLDVLLNFRWALGFSRYGTRWRTMRREFHRFFHPAAALQYRSIESNATLGLLRRLLDRPNDFMNHIKHMAAQIIIKIAYGIDVKSQDDPYIDSAEEALEAMAFGTTARAGLFDAFPILLRIPAWIPGNSFRRKAETLSMSALRGIEKPYHAVKEAIKSGTANPSIVEQMIQQQHLGEMSSHLDENVIMHISGSMYLAGADTIASTIATFFLAMLLYPEAQKTAQAEIDSVIGTDRLPDFTDELPYVTALMKEVLRWRPVAPLAIPHRVVCDDVYDRYLIPKDSIVMGNTWAILHDETTYPDPDLFNPRRFIGAAITGNKSFPDAAFGFGRRICPGRYLARDAVWITIASILATVEIRKALDEKGNEVEPLDEYTSGVVSFPVAFGCRIQPRSSAAERLVQGGNTI